MAGKDSAFLSSLSLSQEPADTFHFERCLTEHGFDCVAGVDEAGRGPLAGPVVAGSVVLSTTCPHHLFVDSKKLRAKERDSLYAVLHSGKAAIGVGIVSPAEIDTVNILQASLEAMHRAVLDMCAKGYNTPDFLLVDGKFQVPIDLQQLALIKGESKSASIAAASIIAKVTRDRIMAEFDDAYPQYGFGKHKGYPTKAHRNAIAQFGPCPIHRRTFKGVREYFVDNISNPEQQRLW